MKFIYLKKTITNDKKKKLENKITIYKKNLDIFQNTYDDLILYGYTNEIRDYTDILSNICEKDEYKVIELEYNNKPIYYFTIECFYENDNLVENVKNILIDELNNYNNLKKEIKIKDDKINILTEGGNYSELNIISKFLRNDDNIKYSSYNKPHPLDNKMILEYIINNEIIDHNLFISKNINKIINYIKSISFYS